MALDRLTNWAVHQEARLPLDVDHNGGTSLRLVNGDLQERPNQGDLATDLPRAGENYNDVQSWTRRSPTGDLDSSGTGTRNYDEL